DFPVFHFVPFGAREGMLFLVAAHIDYQVGGSPFASENGFGVERVGGIAIAAQRFKGQLLHHAGGDRPALRDSNRSQASRSPMDSAMGLRQEFPIQTKRRRSLGAGVGEGWSLAIIGWREALPAQPICSQSGPENIDAPSGRRSIPDEKLTR